MEKVIIKKDSIFHKIPVELDTKQVHILEAIRYSVNMIGLAYSDLTKILLEIGGKEEPSTTEFYSVFKETWSIIDGVTRLENLLSLIAIEGEIEKLEDPSVSIELDIFSKAREFRNTFQHLDERITEVIVPHNRTVWGVLHWLHALDEKNFHSYTLIPGHVRSKYSIDKPNNLGELFEPPIDKIILESVNRSKTQPIININISDLHRDVKSIANKMEKQLESQLSGVESNGHHGQDMFLKMILKGK